MIRLLYLVFGLALGFTTSIHFMDRKLDGIVSASYQLAGASYEKACLEYLGKGNNCHSKAQQWVDSLGELIGQ